MTGTELKEAITTTGEKVATAIDKTENTNAMGIKGLFWNNIGNVSAMAIVSGAFLYLGQVFIEQSKEDRIMFRDEMKFLRVAQDDRIKNLTASQELRWEKTDATHGRSMEKMGETINRATASLENAVKMMEKTKP